MREQGVVSAIGELQLCDSGDRGGSFLFAAGGDALPSATAFRYRPPRGRLRWSQSRLIPGGRTAHPSRSDGLRGIQAMTYVQIQHAEGVRLIFRSKKNKESQFI